MQRARLHNRVPLVEQQELDVSEEFTSTTGCSGRGFNHRHLSPWASTLPLSYRATPSTGIEPVNAKSTITTKYSYIEVEQASLY